MNRFSASFSLLFVLTMAVDCVAEVAMPQVVVDSAPGKIRFLGYDLTPSASDGRIAFTTIVFQPYLHVDDRLGEGVSVLLELRSRFGTEARTARIERDARIGELLKPEITIQRDELPAVHPDEVVLHASVLSGRGSTIAEARLGTYSLDPFPGFACLTGNQDVESAQNIVTHVSFPGGEPTVPSGRTASRMLFDGIGGKGDEITWSTGPPSNQDSWREDLKTVQIDFDAHRALDTVSLFYRSDFPNYRIDRARLLIRDASGGYVEVATYDNSHRTNTRGLLGISLSGIDKRTDSILIEIWHATGATQFSLDEIYVWGK